ncbi:MAG: HAD-IIA family hydrolase [Clostridiales bacterium]|nr:HAD-IIA family hydrolase [Clostridiales bacterium]
MKEEMSEDFSWLKEVKCFVLDMDGTIYLGDEMFPYSLDFLRRVKKLGKQYLFFTNNSSRSGSEYVTRLASMGCEITKDQILTSGDVTAAFLNQYFAGKRVFLLGTPALWEDFRKAGIHLVEEEAEVVVVAFDTTLDYEKLSRACRLIREGAVFLATHPDINCPVKGGFIPDCGAFCAAIELSTGVKPRYLGKPQEETVEMVMKLTGFQRKELAFVGDRLYTDVAVGVNHGSHGILVLSGEAGWDDVEKSPVKPDAVFRDLEELGDVLEREAE